MEIKLVGETLQLSSDKIIFWPKEETIFIADLHLGKTTHFRKAGIAVPTAIIDAEIDRLRLVIKEYKPQRVYFLGDLFHSDLNHEWNIFNDFLKSYEEIVFTLIRGNHDILHEAVYNLTKLKIESEPFQLEPFLLSHHPLDSKQIDSNMINFCGHLHPGISIKGKGRSYLKLPCFYKMQNQFILPAFGRFTGLAKMTAEKDTEIYMVLSNSVKKWGRDTSY